MVVQIHGEEKWDIQVLPREQHYYVLTEKRYKFLYKLHFYPNKLYLLKLEGRWK
jgi:hypothetical protein